MTSPLYWGMRPDSMMNPKCAKANGKLAFWWSEKPETRFAQHEAAPKAPAAQHESPQFAFPCAAATMKP